jgi:hypothetical protein
VKSTMAEELNKWLENYRSPDIRFPEEGNEQQERLADQIDQRMWSYMYGPGMQMLVERIDNRVVSGLSFLKAIGEGTDEKLTTLKSQHTRERDALKNSLSKTQTALWGIGGLLALGTTALAAVNFWPKVKKIFERKKKSEASDDNQLEEDSTIKETKSYFKWKRDRSLEAKTNW